METKDKTLELIEQYRIYIESKDKFVDRNFATNKFFLVFTTFLFLCIFFVHEIIAYKITSTMIFSAIGVGASYLWWSNAHAYSILIAVKLKDVIDKLEESLPLQPHLLELNAVKSVKKGDKSFGVQHITFSEIQNLLAIGAFTIFLIILIVELIQLFIVK